jgi:MoaA/NifB/PqqE/SkfB family radical SAM enzyme
MICTNGGLWNEQNMQGLASDGLSSVIMSIDAHDVAKHEKNRGLPDVCRKIKHANEVLQGRSASRPPRASRPAG